MLLKLEIKKYALIDHTIIEFHQGFSTITGETGAGKSILLGALGLLLGERADVRVVKPGAAKCTVEAVFTADSKEVVTFFNESDLDYDKNECILRREISASGKSRAFINDTPVTVAQIKDLGKNLIDIHSQHQNLLLGGSDFQLKILDSVAQNSSIFSKYDNIFFQYRKYTNELANLKEKIEKKRSDEDYLRYQMQQFDDANLKPGEQEELEQEQQALSHAEEIKETLYDVCNAFNNEENNVIDSLTHSKFSLSKISQYYPEAQSLSERIESVSIELKDIIEELLSKLNNEDYNPSRLQEIDDRLSIIYDLERKHKIDNIEDLLAKAEEIHSQLSLIDDSDEILRQKEKECKALETELKKQAARLTESRKKASETVVSEMKRRLAPLGMPDVRFEISITPAKEFAKNGNDIIEILFSANKNIPLRSISEIASGGEIARVMLCLKAIVSNIIGYPTIIFDEIDTGVSGRIAEQMAFTMQEMSSNNRQVISITHLPQIAAKGDFHYHVYKQEENNTVTSKIILLSIDQRINEIAYMLSGKDITDAAIKNAKELLNDKEQETRH